MTYITLQRTIHFMQFAVVCSVACMVGLISTSAAFAQGNGSPGSNGGAGVAQSSGTQDQLKTQDQLRIQDPATHTGDQPLQTQDQLRTQDRIQTPTYYYNFAAPVQDKDQLRIQDRVQDSTAQTGVGPLQTQDQLRAQDRIYIDTSAALRAYIASTTASSAQATNGFVAQIRDLAQSRNRVQVATMALLAAQNLVGQNGAQMSQLAQGVSSSTQTMIQLEQKIQTRSWLNRFFFGGDASAAQTIQDQVRANQTRTTQLQQYIANCDCTPDVKAMLQEQVQNMDQEQLRLQNLAKAEQSAWGLFSWRW